MIHPSSVGRNSPVITLSSRPHTRQTLSFPLPASCCKRLLIHEALDQTLFRTRISNSPIVHLQKPRTLRP
ncbi:hypothetical protein KC19_VG106500 [Ceratodon purpureus]|uniref:Uncharacterized protein n=1 Tax=Ceratodon purpureus TaxID=3225 RepID=A0A8T0HNS2_CERPU|nr:hypothetical protein KC19_VG106500 [Ceratodon purpureus]